MSRPNFDIVTFLETLQHHTAFELSFQLNRRVQLTSNSFAEEW